MKPKKRKPEIDHLQPNPANPPKLVLRCQQCNNTDPRKFKWAGQRQTGRRYQCKMCGFRGNTSQIREDLDYTYVNRGDVAEIDLVTNQRIVSEKDLIRFLNIDTDEWQVERFSVGKSEAYRKDRQVKWIVENGTVVSGSVNDSGQLLIKPLFSVKVWLKRKTREIRNALAVADLKADLKRFAHRYKRIKYPKIKAGLLFEIEMPDVHLGKLTWHEETGEDSDLKIQTARILQVLDALLAHAIRYPLARILLPIGNDYFNADNKFDTTTAGTPQQEDTRWKKTYRKGRVLAVEMIDRCAALAPVDVLLIPGNHDEERNFYLGDALECWYHKCPNVTINNSAKKRKYYRYGKTLLGFTHGSSEKQSKLQNLMPQEVPELWAQTKFREWHVGDKHHREDVVYKTVESDGVTVRVLRSLSPADAWHYDKGFIGALQASEAFLWDGERGLVAQFTATAD